MHMFAGAIKRKMSLWGYINRGLVDTALIKSRHDELVIELQQRGYNHESPLNVPDVPTEGKIDVIENLQVLSKRCNECARRIQESNYAGKDQSTG